VRHSRILRWAISSSRARTRAGRASFRALSPDAYGKTGSLTPGKEADIIILDATRINVAPLNQVPGAVVSLMDRTNVETVIVAGKVRKWKGQLLDVDLPHLRQQLEASRDYVFAAAGIEQDLFRSN
jgi:5-methylthioadenosine/S-adenosylhomocysteine deaminase